jgi:hypothetical protein
MKGRGFMIKKTLKEWQEEMKSRFGSREEVAFICPSCGKIATVKDHIDAGGESDYAPQQCIGRVNGKGDRNGKDQGFGCNWAAYGFLGTLGKGRIVIMPDGKEVEVFDFATQEVSVNA